MTQVYRRYATEPEALRFREGVEYANDSALTVTRVYEDAHPIEPWVVLMDDADVRAEDAADPNDDLPSTESPPNAGAAGGRDDAATGEDWEDADWPTAFFRQAVTALAEGIAARADVRATLAAHIREHFGYRERDLDRVMRRLWPEVECLATTTRRGDVPDVYAIRCSL